VAVESVAEVRKNPVRNNEGGYGFPRSMHAPIKIVRKRQASATWLDGHRFQVSAFAIQKSCVRRRVRFFEFRAAVVQRIDS